MDRVRGELRQFTDWLAANHAKGYIGEVGWPSDQGEDTRHWNEVGEAWYRDADVAELWVTHWAAGEWWPADEPLAVYVRSSEEGTSLDQVRDQAAVIERHRSTAAYNRGISSNGGEFGSVTGRTTRSTFSNVNPGVYERDWHYDGPDSLRFLASRGATHVAIPFRWERIQPRLGGPLNPDELRRLQRIVADAQAARLGVILNVWNFGAYMLHDPTSGKGIRQPIGSEAVTPEHFNDLWRRLSTEFRGNPGVIGYSLMNEPHSLPGSDRRSQARLWEEVTQQVVRTIRANGDTKTIFVPGYGWSSVATWTTNHPAAWIEDPANNFRYEAHHYFDTDHSGEYREGWTNR